MIRRVLLAISLAATLGMAGFGMANTAEAHGWRHGGRYQSALYGNFGGYYPRAYRAGYYPAYYGPAYYGGYGGCRDRGGLYFSIGF